VASERRTCAKGCGRKFSRPLGSRRVYCEKCSPPRKPKAVAVAPSRSTDSSAPGPIETLALAQLQEAGRTETIEGLTLLRLAREMDGERATASQLGALAEKMLRIASVALAGARKAAPDRLDEITARRAAKAAAAS
jgi:hypothetical protein